MNDQDKEWELLAEVLRHPEIACLGCTYDGKRWGFQGNKRQLFATGNTIREALHAAAKKLGLEKEDKQ